MELEYGTRAWWTTELYLDGQATGSDSTVFTGWRLENRIRPLMRDHAVNPVFYVEYENTSGADKTILEFVGHDGQSGSGAAQRHTTPRPSARGGAEADSLLQSSRTGTSARTLSPKRISVTPRGSSATRSEPLARCAAPASGRECTFCAEKFIAGAEAYGGLGDTFALTMRDTSHYFAPLIGWQLPKGARLSFSPGFGLTGIKPCAGLSRGSGL